MNRKHLCSLLVKPLCNAKTFLQIACAQHASGAIVSGEEESAEAKKRVLRECGVHVVDSPAHIGAKMAEVLGVTA